MIWWRRLRRVSKRLIAVEKLLQRLYRTLPSDLGLATGVLRHCQSRVVVRLRNQRVGRPMHLSLENAVAGSLLDPRGHRLSDAFLARSLVDRLVAFPVSRTLVQLLTRLRTTRQHRVFE